MNVLVYIINIVITTGHQHCLKTIQPVPDQHKSDLVTDQGLYHHNNLIHFVIGYFLLSLIIVAPVDQPPIITGEKC